MMKTRTQKTSTNKKILVTSLLVIIVLAGAGVYFVYAKHNPNNSNSATNPNTQQAQNPTDGLANKQSSPNTDTPEPPTVDKNTGKTSVSMIATATISDGSVFIRGGINAIVNDGSCYAQLTSAEGESIRENTILLQNPSTTDCKTIAIQTSSLSSGSWSVKLYYSSNTTEGVSNEASFEIK